MRGSFRGFEILSRGRRQQACYPSDDERLPELFVRGAGIYKAQLNAENPLGTMQSIEYALRGLDKAVADERDRTARAEKMLVDFEEQAGRPFEHEARLKELLTRQAELNAALDLDKGERQVAPPDRAGNDLEGSDGGADEKVPAGAARSEKRDGRPRRNRPAQRDKRDADEDDDVTVKQRPAPGPKF